jgi:hypothetical protein
MDDHPGQPVTELIQLAEITSVDVHELFAEDAEDGFRRFPENSAISIEEEPACRKHGDALLVIATSASGRNLGRTYILRLGKIEADGWQEDLIRLAQSAQARAAGQQRRGCGVLSSLRARVRAVHDSRPFQFCVAGLIVVGCGLDVSEVLLLDCSLLLLCYQAGDVVGNKCCDRNVVERLACACEYVHVLSATVIASLSPAVTPANLPHLHLRVSMAQVRLAVEINRKLY